MTLLHKKVCIGPSLHTKVSEAWSEAFFGIVNQTQVLPMYHSECSQCQRFQYDWRKCEIIAGCFDYKRYGYDKNQWI